MKFGIVLNAGSIDRLGDLAASAEQAGWDGVFYWDAVHIKDYGEMHDPWVALTVMAMRTSRVRLGGIVMALPRHRPWLFARAATSVDHVSDGRLVLPIGLGALDDTGFGGVGEATDIRVRAERLDESLAILEGLWTGRPFAFQGRHFTTTEMTFEPTPVQQPRIPIWLVGAWPREKSMQRVLRYDGILPNKLKPEGGQETVAPDDIRAIAACVARASRKPRRLRHRSRRPDARRRRPAGADIVRPWADAGATWWTEADWRGTLRRSPRPRRGRAAAHRLTHRGARPPAGRHRIDRIRPPISRFAGVGRGLGSGLVVASVARRTRSGRRLAPPMISMVVARPTPATPPRLSRRTSPPPIDEKCWSSRSRPLTPPWTRSRIGTPAGRQESRHRWRPRSVATKPSREDAAGRRSRC